MVLALRPIVYSSAICVSLFCFLLLYSWAFRSLSLLLGFLFLCSFSAVCIMGFARFMLASSSRLWSASSSSLPTPISACVCSALFRFGGGATYSSMPSFSTSPPLSLVIGLYVLRCISSKLALCPPALAGRAFLVRCQFASW